MRSRPLRIVVFLLALPATTAAPGAAHAQPSEGVEDYATVLHRLIFYVESQHRVLVRSRGELIAITADRVGELFASQVWTGDMPPDSVVPYTLRVREMSNVWLQEIKRELASMEGSAGARSDVQLQWNGAPGTWSMACDGRYPPEVHGRVDDVYMMRPPSASTWFHAALFRGHALVTALSGTVIESASSGRQRPVEMPGGDFLLDVATMSWDAQITENSPAGDGVQGTILASGALTYTGNEGSCRGRWHSP